MTTWYAQNSAVNIDSVNEWNDVAGGTGNWLTWPPAAGDTLRANGKTAILINVNVTCALITCAGGSGTFTIQSGVTITANMTGGDVSSFLVNGGTTPYTVTIVGNVTPGAGSCINVSVSGITLTITGNIVGGGSSAHGIYSSSQGPTINVTGDVTGGSNSSGQGINLASGAATINVTGSVIAATGSAIVTQGGSNLTVTSGNIVDTATVSAFRACTLKEFNPGPTNYIRIRKAGSAYQDYYYTPTDAEIAQAVWEYANRQLTS